MAQPAPQQGPNEFDLARSRASQQNNAAVQSQKDALKRRAAAGGNLNSGSFIKQETQVDQQGQENLQQANEGINVAEQGENRRVREVKEGRDFQRGERESSQKYASGESAMQRRFMTDERLGSQGFAEKQRLGSESFSNSQRLGSQEFASTEAQKAQDFTREYEDNKLNFAKTQFAHEQDVDAFNMKLAEKISNQKGLLEQLFSHFSMGSFKNAGGQGASGFKVNEKSIGGGASNFFMTGDEER